MVDDTIMEIGGEKVEKTGSMQCFDVSEIFFLNSNMYFLLLHVLVCLQNVLKHKDSFGKKIFENEICSTFDKDTAQCISKQLSNFEPNLDY